MWRVRACPGRCLPSPASAATPDFIFLLRAVRSSGRVVHGGQDQLPRVLRQVLHLQRLRGGWPFLLARLVLVSLGFRLRFGADRLMAVVACLRVLQGPGRQERFSFSGGLFWFVTLRDSVPFVRSPWLISC